MNYVFPVNRNSTVNRWFVAAGLLTALRFYTTLCGRIENAETDETGQQQIITTSHQVFLSCA
jgi:hypothetical protein